MPVIQLELDSTGAVSSLKKFDNAVDAAAANTETSFTKMRSSVIGVGKAIGTIAVAGVAAATAAFTGFTVALSGAGAKAKEIEILSRLAGQGVEDFQNFAYATEKYGVSAEKLGDISKDVQDKIGDFIATGAGEFADFFENVAPKVGLTADALAKLSGPDALIAVKKAMDEANISAAEQTFYLESLGNDLSMLEPLLAENGKLWREGAQHAADLGTALSQIQMDNLRAGATALSDITSMVVALKDKVVAEMAPAFTYVVNLIKNGFADSKYTIDELAKSIAGNLFTAIDVIIESVRFLDNGLRGLLLVAKGAVVGIAYGFDVVAQSIALLLSPLSLAIDGMVALGAVDSNPIRQLTEFTGDFLQAQIEGFKATYEGIEKQNLMYDSLKATVKTASNTVIDAGNTARTEAVATANTTQNSWENSVVGVGNAYDQVTQKANAATVAGQQAAAAASAAARLGGINIEGTTANATGYEWTSPDGGTSSAGFGTAPSASSAGGGYVDPNSVSITNNFNQQISKSDVSNIVSEQQRTAARL